MDMDERVSRLQSMFPSIEGDVIAVVLNESDQDSKSPSYLSQLGHL